MDKEQYREAIRTLKEAVKAVGPSNRAWKRWERLAQSHSDRGLTFEEPKPERISGDQALRATVLCMILAHSRGRLHCKIMGRGDARIEMTLALQKKFIQDVIEAEERYERLRAQYGSTSLSPWAGPNLTRDERALAKELTDEARRERYSGTGEDDRDGSGSSPKVAATG